MEQCNFLDLGKKFNFITTNKQGIDISLYIMNELSGIYDGNDDISETDSMKLFNYGSEIYSIIDNNCKRYMENEFEKQLAVIGDKKLVKAIKNSIEDYFIKQDQLGASDNFDDVVYISNDELKNIKDDEDIINLISEKIIYENDIKKIATNEAQRVFDDFLLEHNELYKLYKSVALPSLKDIISQEIQNIHLGRDDCSNQYCLNFEIKGQEFCEWLSSDLKEIETVDSQIKTNTCDEILELLVDDIKNKDFIDKNNFNFDQKNTFAFDNGLTIDTVFEILQDWLDKHITEKFIEKFEKYKNRSNDDESLIFAMNEKQFEKSPDSFKKNAQFFNLGNKSFALIKKDAFLQKSIKIDKDHINIFKCPIYESKNNFFLNKELSVSKVEELRKQIENLEQGNKRRGR